ncbi:Fatty-acyl-CoA reductase, partial [Operophtera brumata]
DRVQNKKIVFSDNEDDTPQSTGNSKQKQKRNTKNKGILFDDEDSGDDLHNPVIKYHFIAKVIQLVYLPKMRHPPPNLVKNITLKIKIDFVPVDYVNNATIAAGWETGARWDDGERGTRVYNVTCNRKGMTTESPSSSLLEDEWICSPDCSDCVPLSSPPSASRNTSICSSLITSLPPDEEED